MEPSEDEVGRMLSRGGPGGPRLDAIWERVQDRVVETKPTRSAWRAGWMWVPVLSVAAGAVLVLRTPESAMAPRGQAAVPPEVQGTCGTPHQPCRVGVPLYLRVLPRHADGVLYVRLLSRDGAAVLLAGPLEVHSESPLEVPAAVRPEPSDVPTGLDIEALWFPQRPPEVSAAVGKDTARSALHLTVAP